MLGVDEVCWEFHDSWSLPYMSLFKVIGCACGYCCCLDHASFFHVFLGLILSFSFSFILVSWYLVAFEIFITYYQVISEFDSGWSKLWLWRRSLMKIYVYMPVFMEEQSWGLKSELDSGLCRPSFTTACICTCEWGAQGSWGFSCQFAPSCSTYIFHPIKWREFCNKIWQWQR